MTRLEPRVVGEAARNLFRTGHGESIAYFYLKACGITPARWIHITSAKTPPPQLVKLAGQPKGFADLFKANVSRLSTRNDSGFPTPQMHGSDNNGYSFFWPITEETQYILRKSELNRSIVWTSLRAGLTNTAGRSPAIGSTGKRVTLDNVFELRGPVDSKIGCDLRLQPEPDYVMHASWYFGPKSGTPMKIPLRLFAIWMHRTDDLDRGTTVDELVRRTVDLLHLTPVELYRLFDQTYPFPLRDDDYTDAWDVGNYFAALCLPRDVQPLRLPTIDARDLSMDLDRWRFLSGALGLTQGAMVDDPQVIADSLISSGKRNVLLYGPPRTGKTHTASDIAAHYLNTSPAAFARRCP